MIMDVAKATPGVGRLEETVRWGQPSFVTPETGSGSTIRIDGFKNDPTKYAMYFICTSGLVRDFRELYRDEMKFIGDRSIEFKVEETPPEAALRHCISLALTYHLRKTFKSKARKHD